MAKMDIKKLAAEHVEKGVFGLFALIVLLALAGTKWKPYSGSPREITDKVAQGQKTLKANVWPEEEMQKFTVSREAAPANIVNERLRREISTSQVEVSGRMLVDPQRSDNPVTEPALKPLQDLIATSARVFVNVIDPTKIPQTESPDLLAGANPNAKPKIPGDDESLPDELRKAANTQMMGGMEGGMPTYGSLMTSAGIAPGGEGMGMVGVDGVGMGMGVDGVGMNLPELKGEGYHFVSVRAVFPLREQITAYAAAINKPFHFAASTFDIIDFELQRQTAQPGDNPWTGEWEPVDMKMTNDVLDKAVEYIEVVSPTITNAVITMPLPSRISGVWDKQATHPRIEKFTLSDSEIAMETEMQLKLLKEAANQQKTMDSMVLKRRGFASRTVDLNQLKQDVLGVGMYQMGEGGAGMGMSGMGMGMGGVYPSGMGGMGGMSGMSGGTTRPRGPGAQVDPIQQLVADMAKGATNKKEEEERIRKWISSLVTADGELLLFRYLDFGVEPGKTYRYRVRLELTNPNFGKRIAEAGGAAEVVEGETRWTDWSNITTPVLVENDVKYYLAEVREQFPRVLPTAFFDVYEWAQQYGTVVNALLDVRFGQQFRQNKETVVIDPAKNKNEKQQFEFKSTDYLVDTFDEVRVEESFHETADDGTAVKFPVGTRGKLPVPPKVLISSIDRDLKFMSPTLSEAEHNQQKDYMVKQKEVFEYLKAPETPMADTALMELGLSESAGPMPPQKGSSRKQSGSSLRIKGRLQGAGAPGSTP